MKRVRIVVAGKVQGVFFRAETERTARSLGLSGFVQNQRDGTVYIEAQGEEEKLQLLTGWCRQGPGRAVVTQITVEEIPLAEEMVFCIRR
ncbi:MAG TPA: acylphosphatase [Bacteroidia bacterium]|nr:acylphosphatase [Bacteroidia bacterium]